MNDDAIIAAQTPQSVGLSIIWKFVRLTETIMFYSLCSSANFHIFSGDIR